MASARKENESECRPTMNSLLFDEAIKQKISKAFKAGAEYSDATVTVSSRPFTHCVVKNFISDCVENKGEFLRFLKLELSQQDSNIKSNDLYKFSQSDELMLPSKDHGPTKNRKHLNPLCSLFRNALLPWMREITCADLNDSIDMFYAQYKYTDALLCHDDELEDRRIAYILYLSEDWKEKDGGSLDLFSVDENGDPAEIVKSLVPCFNSLVFFEVSPVSFHQVSEILSKTKTRISLSGWFHGTPLPRPQRPPSPKCPAITFLPAQPDADLLSQWVNPRYLSIATQATIQEQFEATSEIQLPEFLIADRYRLLTESILHLSSHNEFWDQRGPANKRNYLSMKFDQDFELYDSETPVSTSKSPVKVLEVQSRTELKKFSVSSETMKAYNLVNDFIRLFCSEEMFLYMSNVTGLSFHPMAANFDESSGCQREDDSASSAKRTKLDNEENVAGLNSKCRYEIRCWSKGSYTLISDDSSESGEFALDVNLQSGAEGWEQEFGGFASYIAQGEDVELLTVIPSSNCLSLAYRDSEALRFIKHVNQKSSKSFFDFSFVYAE